MYAIRSYYDPATGKLTATGVSLIPGTYTFTVTVRDNTQPTNLTASKTFSLRVTDLDIDTAAYSTLTIVKGNCMNFIKLFQGLN